MRASSCLFLLLFLTGCGYHLRHQDFRAVEVSVPYVEGDLDGAFTAAVIHEIATRNTLTYTTCGGDVILKICLEQPLEENIGFRFAPDTKTGKVSRILAATEGRLTAKAKISLVEARTGRVLLGPTVVFVFRDFDFESDFSNINFHAFSLGQLEMYQQASDNAYCRLNALLSQKIVDTVEGSW